MEIKLHKNTENQRDVEFKSVGQQLKLFFSYETIIAFEINNRQFVCENVWSKATAMHLNKIEPNKKCRIPRKDFLKKLAKIEFHIKF